MSSVRQLRKNEKFLDELCQASAQKKNRPLDDRTTRNSRLSNVMRHMEIRLWLTGDSRLSTVMRHMEILFDRTNRNSRLSTVT